jgi:hypothetical protein
LWVIKYLCHKDLLVDYHQSSSQFWNAIQKIKGVFAFEAKHQVQNGSSTRFWRDWWSGQSPFQSRFPSLYAIVEAPEAPVAEYQGDTGWDLHFRRELGPREQVEHVDLLREIEGVRLSHDADVII